jgi:2-polyprenyl-3-methyl-5-hydroxy-6-metoxy-1,4-benzoquinol methylase
MSETLLPALAQCYVCHSTRIHSIDDYKGFTHLVCDCCHLVQLHPKHLISNALLYTDSYFSGQQFRETGGKVGYAESYNVPSKSHRTKQYGHYAREIVRCVPSGHGGTVKALDFGCGYGGFLKILQERMRDGIEVHGIDMDPEVCTKASLQLNGARIYCVDLKSVMDVVPQNYFDVITMLDTIEHLDDPRLYLQRLTECSNANSVLLVSTPNIDSLNARLYRDHWILHVPPLHTYYFGPHSISILLQQTGWKVVDFYTERTIFHNERHGLETWRGKTVRLLLQNRFWDVLTNRLLRIGSIMTVVAKRK